MRAANKISPLLTTGLTTAFAGHIAGAVLTTLSGGFWTLYAGTLCIGMANDLDERMTATLHSERKTERL